MNVDIINKQYIFNVNIDGNGNQTVNADIVSKQLIVSVDVFKGKKGDKGDKGDKGEDGINGVDGTDGQDGQDLTLEDFNVVSETTTLVDADEFLVKKDGVWQKITNGNLIGSIPNATTTTRGLVNIGTQTFGGNKTIIGESSTVGNAFEILNSALTSLVKVGNNGNIGVGITNPTSKLDVVGGLRVGSDTIKLGSGESGGDSVFIGSLTNHALKFVVNTNEYMRISTAGYVGIGTTIPTAKISVKSDSSTTGNAFDVKNSAGTELLKVLNNGGVSINGGNTGHKLSINGTLYADSLTVFSSLSSINGNVYLANTKALYFGSSTTISGNDGTNSYINFYLNSLLKFKFSNSGFEILGNIGIILPTPDGLHRYKLSIDNNGLPVTTLIS